jgi:alkanesulfonate monooxygenase SsuD/methylene tetrahydromethanopterin reductase-like flavin-dependent oxidoreductase (luciferase family)
MTTLGVIFSPDQPPERLHDVARAADEAGLEQLWLWEDCFYESGVAAAAAVLGWTSRLTVGIGLLPVPLRNVALTAMEIATIERLFPGRFVPGIGHGVLDWMGQVGARAESPMTLLREYTAALRSLLHGDTVTVSGRYVHLDNVTLDWPPSTPPPLLVGAVKPKTLEVATALGDGVILTGATTPEELRAAHGPLAEGRRSSGRPAAEVVVFVTVVDRAPADRIAARVTEFVDAGATTVALHAVGDDPYPLEDFARLVATEVRAALG